MAVTLFAGIPVVELRTALEWYERLLGSPPAFFPHDTEAVWEVGVHSYLYVVQLPDHAGHARVTLFLDGPDGPDGPDDPDDLDTRVAALAARGAEPVATETFGGGVRKVTYRDPDGNEVGLAGRSAHSQSTSAAWAPPESRP